MINKVIFVTYINRSGSTFFVNNLSKSEDILVCPEAEILIDLFLKSPAKSFNPDKRFFNTLYYAIVADQKLKCWKYDKKDIIQNLANKKTYFDAFIAFIDIYRIKVKPLSTIIVFKAEKLIYYYSGIHHFSVKYNIKFIAVTRDCRAIFYSQNNTLIPETNSIMEINSLRLAKRWNTYIRLVTRLSKKDDFFEISYESLISDFPEYFIFVCRILDIKIADLNKMGDLKTRMPRSHHDLHPLMETKAEPDKINSWNNNLNPSHLYIIEFISGKLLIQRGYKLANINNTTFTAAIRLIFEYLSFLFLKICKSIMYRLSLSHKNY